MAIKNKINKKLEKAIQGLLTEVMSKTNAEKYSLTDRMKVIDRALKLEAIRLKADDSGYGGAFGADAPDDDEPEKDGDDDDK